MSLIHQIMEYGNDINFRGRKLRCEKENQNVSVRRYWEVGLDVRSK